MSIAERIRYLVKRHPKSRQDIAGDLFISADCLGNYITGRRCPDAACAAGYVYTAHCGTGAEPFKPVPHNDARTAGAFFAQRVWNYQLCIDTAGTACNGDSL